MDKMTQAGDNSLDIADPSDWLQTPLKDLASVESILRCQVCKDFYKTPMMTPCEHTFCSICIRRSYSADSKCPTCRAPGQTTHLKRNAVVEELVEAFQKARPAALDFARNISSTIAEVPPKRKSDAIAEADDRPYKRTRSSSKKMESIESREDDKVDGGEYQPSGYSTRSNPANITKQRALDMVECPICGCLVKNLDINAHLDNGCKPISKPSSTLRPPVMKPSRSSQKSTESSTLVRVPFPAYDSMKEAVLRKKLVDLKLPAYGSKLEMQKRHKEWVLLWNANCDAKTPKSSRELAADLDKWERTQGSQAPKASAIGLAIRDDSFINSNWGEEHKDDFAELIRKAREQPKVPNSSTVEATTASRSSLPTPDPRSTVLDSSTSTNSPVAIAQNLLPPNTTQRDAMEPPWPSSQRLHSSPFITDSQFLNSSQSIPSPSDSFLEAVENTVVDEGVGVRTRVDSLMN